MKRQITNTLILVLLAIVFYQSQAQAQNCNSLTTVSDGSVLTASLWNAELGKLNTCAEEKVATGGDTMTGDLSMHSGADLVLYSDTGSTLKASIDGGTGKIIGAPMKVGTYNINLARDITSTAGDSVTIECGGTACSATNPGFVVINGTTAGSLAQFTITSDITIDLTGASWGAGGTGNLTGRILRVLFANDNGTLRTCVALLGGRDTLLTTDTNATQSNIDQPEEVLCNTAVSSATNTVLEIGYVRADFNDTGDVNTIQSGVNDVVTGKSADGLWQPWNPVHTGFDSDPVLGSNTEWTMVGKMITVFYNVVSSGSSDDTVYTLTGPAQASGIYRNSLANQVDGGINTHGAGRISTTQDSNTLTLLTESGSWSGGGNKSGQFTLSYKVGPSASFIE